MSDASALPPVRSASTERAAGGFRVLVPEIVGLLVQFALVVVGVQYILIGGEDEEAESGLLLLWCFIGSIYIAATVLWLNVGLRTRSEDHLALRRFIGRPVMRWIAVVLTFSSSLVGLSAAITLILMRGDPDHLMLYELAAVWAMLVAWALFHWGYARIYHSRFTRAAGEPPLIFPRTENPRLIDFVYFSFTIGTTFAPSDVTVADSRMRWTVVWHQVYGFFFNALIIVLTMNTIAGGLQGQ